MHCRLEVCRPRFRHFIGRSRSIDSHTSVRRKRSSQNSGPSGRTSDYEDIPVLACAHIGLNHVFCGSSLQSAQLLGKSTTMANTATVRCIPNWHTLDMHALLGSSLTSTDQPGSRISISWAEFTSVALLKHRHIAAKLCFQHASSIIPLACSLSILHHIGDVPSAPLPCFAHGTKGS